MTQTYFGIAHVSDMEVTDLPERPSRGFKALQDKRSRRNKAFAHWLANRQPSANERSADQSKLAAEGGGEDGLV